ncbi:MAG: nucleotidyltransferase family protein [Candidatus Omnitrophica bacterium]|nr:nucleotidyltransferase family protein [Candidatus Omnitrophota bacterium]
MKALILAAGYATRLYPLTKEYPKPLLEVGKRPIINYIVDKLEALDDIDEIIVVTNSKFISKFKNWLKHLDSSKRISLVDDLTKSLSDRRGAIGDMNFAINKRRLKDDLIVLGGDNLFNTGLKKFFSFVKGNNNPVIGVYNIKDRRQAKKYGVIKLDKDNRVVDFKEKPEKPASSLVAMCLYYFPKEKLRLVGEYFKSKANKRDATGFYIDWLSKKAAVYGFVFDGFWYDIGDYKFYRQAKQRLMRKQRPA